MRQAIVSEEWRNRMKYSTWFVTLVVTAIVLAGESGVATLPAPVRIDAGLVSGIAGSTANMRVFKGIPFAAPPVGPLRWRPPQPVRSWAGVRSADQFGARCMQRQVCSDMVFRDAGPSEDCLTLNVWTAAKDAKAKKKK